MSPTHLVAALEKTARHLGIQVRYETIERTSTSEPGGGLCRVRGKAVVVIDGRLGATDRAVVLARALAAFGVLGRALPARARAALSPEACAAIQVQAARMAEELATALGRGAATSRRKRFRRGLYCVTAASGHGTAAPTAEADADADGRGGQRK